MTIRAVIFDVGGVLEINPATGWQERWAARLGLEAAVLERRLESISYRGSVGSMSLAEVERATAEMLGLDAAGVEAFMEDLWREYVGTLNVEVARYFAALRPRYWTGILSNSFVGAREREQAAYGLQDMCDIVVYSHQEGVLKPSPRSYAIVCERLRVRPQDAILLDDLPANVEGARRIGMEAIEFGDTAHALAELDTALGAPA